MAKESYAVLLEHFQRSYRLIVDEIGKVIIGQRDVLDQILVAILSRGHCLLVGVPGLAKTLIVSTLADIMTLSFRRIQFTPDLMPSDITGTNVIDETTEGRREFRFVRGPVFANIILADEINRTPPKTQAALLQAMQEREVTVGHETCPLPNPFFVIATQNPIEQEGTYPLPEAQLDRFMFNIWVDYPSQKEERADPGGNHHGLRYGFGQNSERSADSEYAEAHRDRAGQRVRGAVCVAVGAGLAPTGSVVPEFIRRMVDWGAGPRGGQCLIWGAKAFAPWTGAIR
jgi:MoxR-like ATPase